MIEDECAELRQVIIRLASQADDLGLKRSEVASILGIRADAWPMGVARQWAPDLAVWQETRLRQLEEVCASLNAMFGAAAPCWLRARNAATGVAPVAFLLSNGEALRALRDVLRAERGGT